MKINYKEKIIELNEKKTIKEIFEKEISENENIIIAAKCNNEIVPLNYEINENANIELLDLRTKEGMRVYRRGILYIMEKAFTNLYKNALISVEYQIGDSLFCEAVNIEITDEIIVNVNNEMLNIVKKDLPIRKIQMTKEEATKFYEENKSNKGKLQLYAKEKEKVSLYYCEEYFNYFYGVMPISTGYMKKFKLEKKHDGFIIRYPKKDNPQVLSEYENRRKLIQALDEYKDLHKDLDINTIFKLNRAVETNKIKDVILLDEALHEKKIVEIANDIIKRKNVKMILIAGPSSSGKTTFANRLGIQLKINGLRPVTISVDNYFVERHETPRDEFGEYDFESIEAIDLKLFNEHIESLLEGKEVEMPVFDFIEGRKKYNGQKTKLMEDDILVIEGIHCLNDKLTSSISKEQKYKIYISALTVLNMDYYNRISTTDSRLIRRIVRDNRARGYSAIHTLRMWDSVNRGEEKNIFPYQEEADVMFNTSLIYELGVLKPYALPLLKNIGKEEKVYSEAKRLYDFLRYFDDISSEDVPKNSLLREFIGGGVFE